MNELVLLHANGEASSFFKLDLPCPEGGTAGADLRAEQMQAGEIPWVTGRKEYKHFRCIGVGFFVLSSSEFLG